MTIHDARSLYHARGGLWAGEGGKVTEVQSGWRLGARFFPLYGLSSPAIDRPIQLLIPALDVEDFVSCTASV